MSKPQPAPKRLAADESAPQIDAETQRILEERLERDEPSDPWPVVKQRILKRRRPSS
jgi:hypothetical protein